MLYSLYYFFQIHRIIEKEGVLWYLNYLTWLFIDPNGPFKKAYKKHHSNLFIQTKSIQTKWYNQVGTCGLASFG